MYRHILIAASYESDKAVPSSQMNACVRDAIEAFDVDLERIMTYQMGYVATPMAVGLKDIWMNMNDEERRELHLIFPEIAQAIEMMLGVDNGVDRAISTGN